MNNIILVDIDDAISFFLCKNLRNFDVFFCLILLATQILVIKKCDLNVIYKQETYYKKLNFIKKNKKKPQGFINMK